MVWLDILISSMCSLPWLLWPQPSTELLSHKQLREQYRPDMDWPTFIIFPLNFHHSPPFDAPHVTTSDLSCWIPFELWLPVSHLQTAFSKVVPDPIIRPKMLSTFATGRKSRNWSPESGNQFGVKSVKMESFRIISELCGFIDFCRLWWIVWRLYSSKDSSCENILICVSGSSLFTPSAPCKQFKGWFIMNHGTDWPSVWSLKPKTKINKQKDIINSSLYKLKNTMEEAPWVFVYFVTSM